MFVGLSYSLTGQFSPASPEIFTTPNTRDLLPFQKCRHLPSDIQTSVYMCCENSILHYSFAHFHGMISKSQKRVYTTWESRPSALPGPHTRDDPVGSGAGEPCLWTWEQESYLYPLPRVPWNDKGKTNAPFPSPLLLATGRRSNFEVIEQDLHLSKRVEQALVD